MYAPRRMLIFETMSRSALCGVGTRFPGLGRGRAVAPGLLGRGGRIVIRMRICHTEWSVVMRL